MSHIYTQNGFVQKLSVLLVVALVVAPVETVFASTWGPTLLVNTEAFQIIDDGDGASDIELRFGDSLDERLKWNFVNTRFQFTDDVHVEGNITATGSISVDGAADFDSTINVAGAAVFGSTVSLGGVVYTFPGSDGSASQVLTTDSAGNLSWTEKTAGSLTEGSGDNRYVEKAGDTMTGNLIISNNATLNVSGSILTNTNLTINSDSGAADAVLTFGNDAADETFTFSNTTERFELSDDLHLTGNFSATGTLTVDGAADFDSTINIAGAATLQSTLDTVGNITTDANLTINEDAGAADAVLTFGSDATNETLTFKNLEDRFEFSDDVHVTGNLTATGTLSVDGAADFDSTINIAGAATLQSTLDTVGDITTDANLTINEDNGGVDAVLTFGNDAGVETLQFNDATNEFDLSDDLNVTGTLDATGNITTNADLTINADSGAANAVLTFGSDSLNETLTFINTADRFEFSDDIHTTGNITATGTLTVDGAADFDSTLNVAGAAVFGSTVSLGGIVYTFPGSDGSAGQFLQTDGAGAVSWASQANTSGSILFLSPQYPHSVFTGTGVGTLTNQYDATNFENFYRWETSQSVSEPYSVVVQVRIPDNFASWDSGSGAIQLRYRTSATSAVTDNINVTLRDTAGAAVSLTGASNLTSATAAAWNTAVITGPESGGTYTPGDFITLTMDMEAASATAYADIGWIELNWDTTLP